MKKEIRTLVTSDRLKLYAVFWRVSNNPRAIILILHGYGEHINRYERLAIQLVNNGHVVCGFDQRGHGRSEGLRAHIENIGQLIDDIKGLFDQIRSAYRDPKIFIYGHSMGSLLALAFALQYKERIAGLILSGTAINGDQIVPRIIIPVGKLLAIMAPKLPLIPGLKAQDLTHDPEAMKSYNHDPLIYHGRWRIKTGIELIQLARSLRRQLHQVRLPILIMHGEVDPITPVSGSQLVYEQVHSINKTLKIYSNVKHEIHMEDQIVAPEILNWLEGLLQKGNH